MKEIVYVYTASVYMVFMITGLVSVYQLDDKSASAVYEVFIAYDFSCILVVLYYFLHLLVPHSINPKFIVFIVTHYIFHIVSSILTFIYYESIDNDVTHIYIVMFTTDLCFLALHAKYFYDFLKNPQYYNYQPMIIEKIIKQQQQRSANVTV